MSFSSRRVGAVVFVLALMVSQLTGLPAVAGPGSSPKAAPFFSAEGDLTLGHPLTIFGSLLNPSVTAAEYFTVCNGEPLSNGVDALVFPVEDLPPGSIATATGSGSATGSYDLDLWFYDADCFLMSGASTAEKNETSPVPNGTGAILVTSFTGANIHVALTVEAGAGGGGGSTIPESMTPSSPRRTAYPSTPDDEYFTNKPLVLGDPDSVDPAVFEPQQWGPQKIGAPQAWQEQRATGAHIKVAVLDSGLDVLHPDLSCPGKVYYEPSYDVVQDGNGPEDVDGHGTHVAGIIGACTNNGTGIAGVAPDVQILPFQVFSSDPGYDGDANDNGDDDLADAIKLATDEGAHVISMSLSYGLAPLGVAVPGGGSMGVINEQVPGQDPFTLKAINDAITYAQDHGVVIVAAAGNDTVNQVCDYPSIAKDVICVGATDPRDARAWYSNGTNKVRRQDQSIQGTSVVAPGGSGTLGFVDCSIGHSEEIYSLYARDLDECDDGGSPGYESIFGTSMATPHVAGLAALVYDRIGGARSKAEADRVIDAITSTAVDLGTPGYDPVFGYGRIDAVAAVSKYAAEPFDTTTTFTPSSATSGPAGGSAVLEAQVIDEDGYSVAHQEVTFGIGDLFFESTTDESGIAQVTMPLGAAGSYEASAMLQQSLLYDASEVRIPFNVE